jgi:hypothetical protein
MNATIIIEEGGFRLVRYDDAAYEPEENYLTLWHMHPERKKKQGLVSDGRKCMDCDAVAPEVIGCYPVESDGYVASEWHKAKTAEIEADRLVRAGWSEEKKEEDIRIRALRKQSLESINMNMDEWREWMQKRKEQGNEYMIWMDADDEILNELRSRREQT